MAAMLLLLFYFVLYFDCQFVLRLSACMPLNVGQCLVDGMYPIMPCFVAIGRTMSGECYFAQEYIG